MKNKQTLSVWKVRSSQFPVKGKIERQIKFLLRYAILAPSGHNSQPWKFNIEGNKLKIYADLNQSRPEVDPHNRELYISVGCAITNLEIAAKNFSMTWRESWWPHAKEANLVAEMEFGDARKIYPNISPLFEAITQRTTYRGEFEPAKEVPAKLFESPELVANKASKIRWVKVKTEKEKVGQLVAEAQKIWFRSKKLTEELEFWLKQDIAKIDKKVNSGVLMLNNFSKRLKEFMGSEFMDVDSKAERDKKRLLESPAVGVVMSKNDNLREWVDVGRQYQYMALLAASLNLQVGFFNSVAELPKKRAQLAIALGEKQWPQLLFRVGYGKRGKMSPRKPIEAVMI
jgi:hypothetical protein